VGRNVVRVEKERIQRSMAMRQNDEGIVTNQNQHLGFR